MAGCRRRRLPRRARHRAGEFRQGAIYMAFYLHEVTALEMLAADGAVHAV